jgi:hypothetical protein
MEEDSSVERLKKKLYVRNKVPQLKPRHELHELEREVVPRTWESDEEAYPEEQALPTSEETIEGLRGGQGSTGGTYESKIPDDQRAIAEAILRKKVQPTFTERIIKVVFIASFIFFLFALGLAGYYLWGGQNQVSCENTVITLSGPRSVASGKKLLLDVAIENNNPVAIRDVGLEMRFPEGTRDAEQSTVSMTTSREQVGTIEVGEKVRTTANVILFGQDQTESEVKAIVTYSIDDSNATFSCEQTYKILIATSPISLQIEGLEEISSGQELTLKVVVTSNSEEVVPDLRLIAEYPYGFEFISSEPKPTTGNDVWELGDVEPNSEHTMTLRGVVKGQGTEARIINFSIGERDSAENNELGTILQKIDHPLLISKPFLELNLSLNGSSEPQTVAKLGEQIHGTVHFKNTLPNALHDVEIDAVFDAIMLDLSSVQAGTGFFRSVDKTIIWTPQTDALLKVLEPGQEGDLVFSFRTKPFEEGTSVKNPGMSIEFAVRGRRIADSIPVPQNLLGQSKRTIFFDSDIMFTAYAVYGIGPFLNTGPHPPRVDKNTTYTIIWSLKNNLNTIESGTVRGVLPVNITWMNSVSPASESVVYNPVTREVSWTVGDVPRGTGYQTEPRQVYFQVATTPSITQLNDEIVLVSDGTFQGIDSFTKNVIEKNRLEANTNLKNDPHFMDIWGSVRE